MSDWEGKVSVRGAVCVCVCVCVCEVGSGEAGCLGEREGWDKG